MRTVFDPARNESGLVDRYIGTAFDIVLKVHDNLAQIKQASFYMEDIVNVNNHMEELLAILAQLDKLVVIYGNLDWLKVLSENVNEYLVALNNYKTLLASQEGATHIGTSKETVSVQGALDTLETNLKTTTDNLTLLAKRTPRVYATRDIAMLNIIEIPENAVVIIMMDESAENSLTFNVKTTSSSVPELVRTHDWDSLKKALLTTGGAGMISTVQSKTVQEFLDDQYNWGIYYTPSHASAVTFSENVKPGTLIMVMEDETLDDSLALYKVTSADTVSLVWNFSALGRLIDGDDGSDNVGHTNADNTKTTVKALLNKHTTDIAAVKVTADAAATKTALTAVKTTADAAAPQTALTTTNQNVAAVKVTADAAATQTALAAVKVTADAAATQTALAALTARVVALESAAGGA